MAEGDKKKLVVLVSRGASDDRATVAFTIANAALSTGMQVGVFLTSDGVELSRDGASDQAHFKPFKQLDELVEKFLDGGGVVWSCSPCFQHRGLNADHNYKNVIVTGAGPMVEWISQGAATLSL